MSVALLAGGAAAWCALAVATALWLGRMIELRNRQIPTGGWR